MGGLTAVTIDLLCVGAANLDVIAAVDRAPQPDQRVHARQIVHAGGGPAATAAVAAARQGITVGFCGRVGRDPQGEAIIEGLEAEGIDVSYMVRDREITSGSSVIVVDLTDAGRMICAGTAPAPDRIHAIGSWVHVDQVGHDSLTAEDRGRARISVDHGNPIPRLDLHGVDLYAPARPMLQAVRPGPLPDIARAAAAEGAAAVVVTDGSAGAWVLDSHDLRLVEGFHLDGPLSTLGAGDVFHGALLAGLIHELPLIEAVTRANACAALSCRGLDGRSTIPTATELDDFLRATDGTPAAPRSPSDQLQSKGRS